MLWRLGVLVLSTILVAATLILYLGPGFQRTYQLTILCDTAPGVTPETPIHRNGILIGRVDSVQTLDEGGVELSLRINEGVRLFDDEIAEIGMTSLLGESIIEFVPGVDGVRGDLLTNDYTITNEKVRVMPNPLNRLDEMEKKFEETSSSIKNTSDQIGDLAKLVKEAMGDDAKKTLGEFFAQIRTLTTETTETMENFNEIGASLNKVFGNEKTVSSLNDLINTRLPSAFDKADQLAKKFDGSFGKIEGLLKKADSRLDEIGVFTKELADKDIGQKLIDSLDDVGDFFAGVKNSEGTIGLLLNDPTLYNRMNNSLRRIESITYKLEPILKDVRVFSSKIATDPRQLGVKGALDRRPSGSGVKGNFLVPQRQESEMFSPRDFFREP